jgi:hypothetical protein
MSISLQLHLVALNIIEFTVEYRVKDYLIPYFYHGLNLCSSLYSLFSLSLHLLPLLISLSNLCVLWLLVA